MTFSSTKILAFTPEEFFDEQHKYTTLTNWPLFLFILGEVEPGDCGWLEMYFVWWK
jgi:hypothetical protein